LIFIVGRRRSHGVLNQAIKDVREDPDVFGGKKLPHSPSIESDTNSPSNYSSCNRAETFQEYNKEPATEADYYSKERYS
jgi:hypothetical protein